MTPVETDGVALKGQAKSVEHRAKLRAANLGKKDSPETRLKKSMAHIGKPKSAAHRAAISAAKRGLSRSLESRHRQSASRKGGSWTFPASAYQRSLECRIGVPLTPEHRAKLSAAKLANPVRYWLGKSRGPLSPEARQKIGLANRGRGHTQETRRKISLALQGHPGAFVGRTHTAETRRVLSVLNRGRSPAHPKRQRYRGVWMRSGFEVRAAKAFDALNLTWVYEPKRFDLGECTYVPDFYLPSEQTYWETKGWYGPDSRRVMHRFRVCYPEVQLVLATKPVLLMLERAANRAGQCMTQLEGEQRWPQVPGACTTSTSGGTESEGSSANRL